MKGSRFIRSVVAVVCLLAAGQAVGGTVYRCEGVDGSRSYVSKRLAGAKCTVVSSYRASPQRVVPVVAETIAPAPQMIVGHAIPSAQGGTIVAPEAPKAPAAAPRGVSRVVQGQVYSYIKDGVRHYASKAPKGNLGATAVRTIKYRFIETCFACGRDPGINFNTLRLNTSAYAAQIRTAATQYGVDEAIVRAIIHAESAFNPNALSRVGAQGLMQLMPGTARRFGVGNAFDAAQNIDGGVQYLAFLLKRFKGDLTLAAAGYNAGEGAVDKYNGVPPYSETQRYVQRVGVLAERYRGSPASAN